MSLFQKELRDHAEQLIAFLATRDIHAVIIEQSFRDYMVKLDFGQAGRVNIYYSPKKDTFSLVTGEMKAGELKSSLEGLHTEFAARTGIALKTDGSGNGANCPKKAKSGVVSVPQGWAAYVDGSFADGRVGYGVVILKDGLLQAELGGIADIPVADTQARQIGGELMATMKAVEWCIASQVATVTICYDLVSIRHWALGEWKANIALTQRYQAFMQEALHSGKLTITWQKVDAHTGVKWNEHVDRLARNAAQRDIS